MDDAEEPMFRCEVCGRPFAWTPQLAGTTITCKCLEPVQVPAEPESDLYELAPAPLEPPKPVLPATPGGLAAYDASPVLTYRRMREPGEVEQGYSEANPLIVSRWKDLALPILLIVAGTLAEFAWAHRGGASVGQVVRIVGRDFTTNVLAMLVGVIVAAQCLGLSFGPVPTAILKLGGIALGPVAVQSIVIWALGGGLFAGMAGWVLGIGFYVALFWYLFELDMEDVWQTVLVIYAIRVIAHLLLWAMHL